jgi:prepilin signal peptidase PulO-like enzyme (type II secretory pathway)
MFEIYQEAFEQYPILPYIVIFLLGLCLGSFTSAISYRVPHKLPWAFEKIENQWVGVRSMCPNCKTPLQTKDLFPVMSWVFAGAKCNHCGQKISIRYPLQEIFFAAFGCGLLYFWKMNDSTFWAVFLSMPFLIAFSVALVQKKFFSFISFFIVLAIWMCKFLFFNVPLTLGF